MAEILIIDDDENFGELMLERLEGAGYQATFRRGPFGSINTIRAETPRLLILDINMPGLKGTSLAELVRKHGELANTRVMLMSSMDQDALDKLVPQHGADAGLTKSANRAELLAVVQRLLQR